MWEVMVECIRRSAKVILGISRGGGSKTKGGYWWNKEVNEKVKKRKEVYTDVMNSETEEERDIRRVRHKAAKKVSKKAVVVAKNMAFDRLYHRLETKEWENEIFKLARLRKEKQGI